MRFIRPTHIAVRFNEPSCNGRLTMIQRPVKWCLNLFSTHPPFRSFSLSLSLFSSLIYTSLARFHSPASSRYTALERWSHELRTSRTMLLTRNDCSDFLVFSRSIINVLSRLVVSFSDVRTETRKFDNKLNLKINYFTSFFIYYCTLMHSNLRFFSHNKSRNCLIFILLRCAYR